MGCHSRGESGFDHLTTFNCIHFFDLLKAKLSGYILLSYPVITVELPIIYSYLVDHSSNTVAPVAGK
jgi:hypothetical protein